MIDLSHIVPPEGFTVEQDGSVVVVLGPNNAGVWVDLESPNSALWLMAYHVARAIEKSTTCAQSCTTCAGCCTTCASGQADENRKCA